MLEIRDLRAGYGVFEVLRGITLEVRTGEIVALLGSNGAGKSTAINTVCGLLKPLAGSVTFQGRRIDGRKTADIVRAGLVQVPEGRRVFPNLSVRENLQLGCYRRARARQAQSMSRVLSTFPRLGERLQQKAGTLSGGEQQMLAIGRAMMSEPRFLILDEPSLGLSPRLVEDIFALIGRLHAEGLSILLVEQNVAQSLAIAQRAYVLENGAIAFDGVPADLFRSQRLREAYLGL